MKNAYELAMERLERESGPGKKLTDSQRSLIAEIDSKCDAKVAENKLSYEVKLKEAKTSEELNQIKKELAEKISSININRDKDKEEVWDNPQT